MVEVVGGKQTSDGSIATALSFYEAAGMNPLHVRVEIDAFIADRLLEAVWREALWLVKDGVATTQEIDDVIRLGFGLRWAQMGLFENYRIAGGEGGGGAGGGVKLVEVERRCSEGGGGAGGVAES